MTSQDPSVGESTRPDVPLPPSGKLTEEEFVAWCDEDTRAEWVDGEVVIESPPSFAHSDLSTWLGTVLLIFVEEQDLGVVVSRLQVRFEKQRRRRTPDLLFLAKDRLSLLRTAHVEGPPDLVIEIVSPESEGRDWREKYLEYETAGVKEYWVIDPMSQHVDAYALTAEADPKQRQYGRIEEQEGVISSTVLPGFRLKTAWLWPQTRPKLLEALQELGLLGPSGS